jgi:hypothetical protein
MCEEMKKLREMLTKRGIEWKDASSIVPDEVIQHRIEFGMNKYHADSTMYRTHFETGGNEYSVIYGYGSYGGYDPFNGYDPKLLECMTSVLNGGEPVGYMTAEDVMNVIDGKHFMSYL